VLRNTVVGITAVGGRIATMQGQQEAILIAALNVTRFRNMSRDCWKMMSEWVKG
jgi:hypothetical protein